MPSTTPACVAANVSVGEFDCARGRIGIDHAREAEVENLDLVLGRQHHVGRLQIAMDDALLVRGFEGVEHLPGVRDGFVERQRALSRAEPASDSPSMNSRIR